jgi:thymidylate synthase ThyX
MRIEKSKVEILEQEPGIIGMYRFIERAGRVAYKTEDKITEDSWQKFLKMLKERGHWAVFNQGTVYLRFNPAKEMEAWKKLKETKPWTKWTKDADWVNVTTNFRVILQLDLGDFMEKYWTEPDASFYRRIGSHWVCSRLVSHQLVRHRIFNFLMESQRYCNYSKGKFGAELTFIQPCFWDERGTEYKRWLAACGFSEKEYLGLLENGSTPQEARSILPNSLKTELVLTGVQKDWKHFLNLRCAKSAHPQAREVALMANELFKEDKHSIIKYKEETSNEETCE